MKQTKSQSAPLTKKIKRVSEGMTVSVVAVLGLSVLASACSSSGSSSPETTGSISRPNIAPVRSTGVGGYGPPMTTAYRAPVNSYATYQSAPAASPDYVGSIGPRLSPPATVAAAGYPAQPTCACDRTARLRNDDYTGSISPPPTVRPKTNLIVHRIQPNESLYSISRAYHTPVDDIAFVNRIDPDSRLRYGELLVIPQPGR